LAIGYSPIIPLQKNVEDGFYALTKTVAANTKQNLKNLLLTVPGERVMIPDFGVGLRHYLFTNQGDTIEADLSFRIESQVGRYLPYVSIDNLDFSKQGPQYLHSDFENRLNIRIYYSVPSFSFSDLLEVSNIKFS